MANMRPQAQFPSASLYVGDLHRDISEAMLYEVFNAVGPVASIRVCRDSASRRSLGYAYVNYHTVQDAERALDTLNFTLIRNMPCRIMWSHRDPSLRKSGSGNIFVKNLDKTIDNKALYDTFSLFGNILSCKVAQDEFGRSRGFGFVHYETAEAAKTATDRVNNMQIGSKTVYVGPFLKQSQRSPLQNLKFTNVYVKNIPRDWSEEKVKETFSKYGAVTSMALHKDSRGRPFGYVNFEQPEGAKEAIEHLNGLKVGEEETKKEEPVEGGEGSSEQKDIGEGDKETTAEGEDKEDESRTKRDTENDCLYVCRFQSKGERASLLKSKFDQFNDQRNRRSGVNLYIKNLHETIDDARLRELFEPFGSITSARVMMDHDNISKGFGFVSYLLPDEATKAVTDMHLKLVEGKPLYVALAERREERSARLQQKLRPNHMRPRMPAVPQQIQFGAPPPGGMYFGSQGLPHDGAVGYVPQMGRGPMSGGYPPMMGWNRTQPPGGMRGSQPGMPGGQLGGLPGYSGMSPSSGGVGMGNQGGSGSPMGMGSAVQPGGHPGNLPRRVGLQMPPPTLSGGQLPMHAGGPMMPSVAHPAGHPMHEISGELQSVQKQMLGEQLFPRIANIQPKLAGKITGMMLDMDIAELNRLLESESQLKDKVEEALRVLRQAQDPAVAGEL